MPSQPSAKQRRDLGIFLSSWRTRLQLEEYDLYKGSRRKPGLRRQAMLCDHIRNTPEYSTAFPAHSNHGSPKQFRLPRQQLRQPLKARP